MLKSTPFFVLMGKKIETNINIERDLGLSLKLKSSPKQYTQDYIPLVDVKDGVCITNDGPGQSRRYIKILKIIAVNLTLKTPEEQDSLVMSYFDTIKSGPSDFQIKIVNQKTDVNEYINTAYQAFEKETNENIKSLIQQYTEMLKRSGNTSSYDRHYYFIFEYKPDIYDKRKVQNENDILAALNKQADHLISDFHSIGNDVILANAKIQDTELLKFLYEYYNPRTSRHESFNDRVERIHSDQQKLNPHIEQNKSFVDLRDLVAPKSLDFINGNDYYIMDGMYYSHLFVRSASYPSVMRTIGGWLSEIIMSGAVDVDIYFKKVDTMKKLSAIKQHSKWANYKLNSASQDELNYDEVSENYQGTLYMKSALTSGGQDVYDMVVLLTIKALTINELYEKYSHIEKLATKKDFILGECKRFEDEGFITAMPFSFVSPKIFNLSHRNLTTAAVAASYPFTNFVLRDKNGVVMGKNRSSSSLVIYDPFDPDQYANANMGIYGSSGFGKTFTLLLLTMRLRYHGKQIFILSPEKQDEFRRPCEAVGGEFIDISPSSEQRINIFDIIPLTSPETKLLGGEKYTDKSWLVEKIESLLMWISYLYKDITRADKAEVETILMNLYKSYGITENNDSIYLDKEKGIFKEFPIMSDFYNALLESSSLDPDIARIVSVYVTGAARNMNGHTNVDLNNKFIVFGMENLKGDLLAPTMFIVLDFVWAKVRMNKTEHKIIAIDEGWLLLNGQDEQVGAFVQRIFKLARGYGAGAIFATQDISDLYQSENNYGNAIISCSHSNFVLGMKSSELAYISKELGLTPAEQTKIITARAPKRCTSGAEAILCAGSNHIPINVQATETEKYLFTTKTDELAEIAKEMKKKLQEY